MIENNNKKIAIVTGGSRGIGREIALTLSRTGYYVVVTYVSSDDEANKTLDMIKKTGQEAELAKFDVADNKKANEAISDIIARHKKIDVLVNNAGITSDGLFIMMSEKSWDSVLNTTLKGYFNITKPVLKNMVRQKKGSIVSISSVSGLIGNRGQANYSAAKAGLIGACKATASEVARLGIRVNVVAPGLIDTEMIKDVPPNMLKTLIPMARVGKPSEVANVVKFLCSDDASYVTGQVIGVNGGMV